MKIKNILKEIGIDVLIVTIVTLLGCLLLYLMQFIPQQRISENAVVNRERFIKGEFTDRPASVLYSNNISSYIDAYADDNMIDLSAMIGYEYEDIYGNHYVNNGINPVLYITNQYRQYHNRYWNGWILYIRPLLIWFNQSQITTILAIATIVTLLILVLLLLKNKKICYTIALLGALVLSYSEILLKCMEYVAPFLIGIIYCIVIVVRGKKKDTNYTLNGALTMFFDFWTTPTIALTIPLIYDIYSNEISIKDVARKISQWVIGYAGMFITRIITILVMGRPINDITVQLDKRLNETDVNIFNVLKINASCLRYLGLTAIVIMLILAVIIMYMYMENKRQYIYLAISIIPILELVCFKAHSYTHYYFTYRTLMTMIMALILIIINPLGFMIKNKCERKKS